MSAPAVSFSASLVAMEQTASAEDSNSPGGGDSMSPGPTERSNYSSATSEKTLDSEISALEDVNRVSSNDKRLTARTLVKGQKFDQFHDVDKARKKLLHTQACDGTWHLLAAVAPSVLPVIISSIDFWLSVAVYLAGRILTTYDVFAPTVLGEFRGLHTMGFVLAFMLNFYVNTSISRLFETNRDAMRLISHINNVAVLLRGYLWDTPEKQLMTYRCIDYLCASHVHCYIGFADVYTAQNLWEGFNEEFGVLTERENKFLSIHRENGGSRYRECIVWAMEELHQAVVKGYIAPPIAAGINAQLTGFEDSVQALFDFRYLPIPFVSEHLLVFFIHIYLPIQTFEMAVQCEVLKRETPTEDHLGRAIIEIFGCLLALLANLGFQGLFSVGAFLEQPYGDKTCHSRVSTFCRLSIREARKTLSAGSPRTSVEPLTLLKGQAKALEKKLAASGVIGFSDMLGIRAKQDMLDLVAVGQDRADDGSDLQKALVEKQGQQQSDRL